MFFPLPYLIKSPHESNCFFILCVIEGFVLPRSPPHSWYYEMYSSNRSRMQDWIKTARNFSIFSQKVQTLVPWFNPSWIWAPSSNFYGSVTFNEKAQIRIFLNLWYSSLSCHGIQTGPRGQRMKGYGQNLGGVGCLGKTWQVWGRKMT